MLEGAAQVKETYEELVVASFRAKLRGVLGTNQSGKTALVVDEADCAESPITFVAMSLVTTTDELESENGTARSTVIGIVQDRAETMPAFDPLQFVSSSCQDASEA